ncbi:50S ribosomal protein L1 [Gracilariopsis chorda]|uniref:Ribosomal protein n=1 Tax=Gracilariopsis chorda TaxID=448386 RepID=A0A2V3J1R2_9FLOR|nr:50S ribosomal protein L1 [Gracilariopsis chorda]|eukprot:PXF48263.1 50S ribosomal protein L1 [Gracilariopsis chorda]
MLASLRSHFARPPALHRLAHSFRYATLTKTAPPDPSSEASNQPLSRWQRLKRERRAAPTPLNRTKHQFDRQEAYDLHTALKHVRAAQWAQFDETLELVLRLKIDPRHADHNLRGVIRLPHGTGRVQKVAVLASDEQARQAIAAGADLVGGEELIDKIVKEKGRPIKGFEACVAVPRLFGKVAARLGKILGPKGLMPSPKTETVTDDIENIIKEVKRGRLSYRTDKAGNMHLHVGKLSFPDDALIENTLAAMRGILEVRPASVKGKYVLKAIMCSSMGPSVNLDHQLLTRKALE